MPKILILEWNQICQTNDAQKTSFRASKRLESSRLEKLLKIVSCAETEKLKEEMVGPQVE